MLQFFENDYSFGETKEKLMILKAIGNAGMKWLIDPALTFIKDSGESLEVRVAAVYSLRRIAAVVPQKVCNTSLDLFRM